MIGHEFPYLDTRDLNLDWLLKNMKKIIEDWATYQQTMNQKFDNLEAAFNALQAWINNYFDNLDVQEEINNKLNDMKQSGELATIMNPLVANQTATWLAEHITNPSNPPIDTSLSVSNAAADAKVVGDYIRTFENNISDLSNEGIIHVDVTPWMNGTISDVTGEAFDSSDVIRTANFIPVLPVKYLFSIEPTYKYAVITYNNSKNFIASTQYLGDNDYILDNTSGTASYIRIKVAKTGDVVREDNPPDFSCIIKNINTENIATNTGDIARNTVDIAKIPVYYVYQGSWGNTSSAYMVMSGFYKPATKYIKVHIDKPLAAAGNYYKVGLCEFNDSPYGNIRKQYSYKVDVAYGFTPDHIWELHDDTVAISCQIGEYDSNNQIQLLSVSEFDNYKIWIEECEYIETELQDNYVTGSKMYCEIGNGTIPNTANLNCVRTISYIPCLEGDIVYLNPTRPVPAGHKYYYGYSLYDSEKVEIKRVDIYVDQNDFNYIKIENGVSFIRFSVGEQDESRNIVPIRLTDFTNYGYTLDAYIQSSNGFIDYIKYSLRDTNDDTLPDYWIKYLENKIEDINLAISDDVGFYGSSFYFFTDIHWNENEKYSPAIINWIKERSSVNTIIQGGDILDMHDSREAAFSVLENYREHLKNDKPVNLVGNHDDNSNGQPSATSKFIGAGTFFRMLNARTENDVHWVPGTNYGYQDIPDQKIRYYYLDTGTPDLAPIDNDQKAWFESSIDAVTAEWSIIVFGHMFLSPRSASYESLVMNANGWYVAGVLENIIAKASHPKIIAMICGHTHRDFSLVYNGLFPVICTTCDAGQMSVDLDPETEYAAGTITAQAIDIFYVNTQAQTLKTIRIGNGSNRSWTYNN